MQSFAKLKIRHKFLQTQYVQSVFLTYVYRRHVSIRTEHCSIFSTILKLCDVTFPLMSRFLTYIGDLCVSKGMAIQRVQAMVCEVVLKDSNADVLMTLRYVHT